MATPIIAHQELVRHTTVEDETTLLEVGRIKPTITLKRDEIN